MREFSFDDASIPFILIALNQFLKNFFNMDSKKAILVNVAGGLSLHMLFISVYPTDPKGWLLQGLAGFLLGMSAGGMYDLKDIGKIPEVKNLLNKDK